MKGPTPAERAAAERTARLKLASAVRKIASWCWDSSAKIALREAAKEHGGRARARVVREGK